MTSTTTTSSLSTQARSGFTLVEILIVVVIIGLLAAMAIPTFKKIHNNSNASRIANDFRVFSGLFEVYSLEAGDWPEDGNGNNLPEPVRPYFEGTTWSKTQPNGGEWDWEYNRLGVVAAVALSEGSGFLDDAVYERVDEILDDGNLATGDFIRSGDRFIYILQH